MSNSFSQNTFNCQRWESQASGKLISSNDQPMASGLAGSRCSKGIDESIIYFYFHLSDRLSHYWEEVELWNLQGPTLHV